MSLLQKLALAAAIAGALTVILRKAWAYERSSREEGIPTLLPAEDAEPAAADLRDRADTRKAAPVGL